MVVLIPFFVAGAAASALIVALISQYGFDLQPCVLCIWQRWPYVAAIALGIAALLLHRNRSASLVLSGLAIAAVLVSGGIGAFHVGVEQGWWEGTATCGSSTMSTDLATLKAQIMNAPITRCDEVAFSFLGISMAGWNALFALGVALVAIRAIVKSTSVKTTSARSGA